MNTDNADFGQGPYLGLLTFISGQRFFIFQNRNRADTIIRRASIWADVMVPNAPFELAPVAKFRFNDVFGLPGLKWFNTLIAFPPEFERPLLWRHFG